MSADGQRVVPIATYRVQLHGGFGFLDAGALADYLARLGIGHLYCSPYLRSTQGSAHGYDVVDHGRLDDELGGAEGHATMTRALSEHGLGHIVDVVPNHMATTDPENRWWWDVLKKGPASPFAPYFDIEWDPPEVRHHRSILIPILGDHYGRVLTAGELKLERLGGEAVVRYHEHVLPLSEESSAHLSDGDLAAISADADSLHELLDAQHYRLAKWRMAGHELNYRRFFAINELAALRTEDPDVFAASHELVLSLISEGELDGLRIDHIDGLRRPLDYLTKLRNHAPRAYIVVEKILEPHERLRPEWPVEGTTGYDFLNLVSGLFVDPDGEKPLGDLYSEFTAGSTDLPQLRRAHKLLLMETELASDVERLADRFISICESDRNYRDFTRHDAREAIKETIAAFAVYRTYVDATTRQVTEDDRRHVEDAVEEAKSRRPDLEGDLFDFLRRVLLLDYASPDGGELAMRFQQSTGPVMAKGVEDTTFYVFNRLISLNEVGGDPGKFGTTVEEFHAAMEEAQRTRPLGMLASSTHDTKRSEDVRARLALLSEMPDRWAGAVQRWRALNDRHRSDGRPDRNAEYLLYQTLVGAWPLSQERASAFMEKAAKEAKAYTSWIDPNPLYDEALARFVSGIMSERVFRDDLASFVADLIDPGYVVSLAQLLVKLTAPGVPDVYQGTELWDLSLVDPDNRRPVDYDLRRELLDEAERCDAEHAWRRRDAGLPKIFTLHHALHLRRERPHAFGPTATYRPLLPVGPRAQHAVAFARSDEVVTLVPRLVLRLGGEWDGTSLSLPEGRWENRLTSETWDGEVDIQSLLDRFPVALLVRSR